MGDYPGGARRRGSCSLEVGLFGWFIGLTTACCADKLKRAEQSARFFLCRIIMGLAGCSIGLINFLADRGELRLQGML